VRTKLVTIRFSHFNEKARWALDRFGVPYDEEGWLPGFHVYGVLKLAPRHGLGRRDAHATRFGTPVMVTPEGQCVRDSSAIVRYVSDRYAGPGDGLYPTAEVADLEASFSDLGAHTRRFAYFYLLDDRAGLGRVAEANAPRQAAWFKRVLPVVTTMIARGLRVTPAGAARSLEKLRATMDAVSERIDGRRYLVGDRFTAADLAFACMTAPLLLPRPEEGYGAVFPPLEETPAAFADVARAMRETPAGRFALRMFREERRRA